MQKSSNKQQKARRSTVEKRFYLQPFCPSSETQGQLVGTTGFSWAKVYNESGRAPGHLLLPNEFQKRLKSRLLIGEKNFRLANQRRGTAGDSRVFLHEVVFLINLRSSVACSTRTFLRRASEKKKINEVEEIANYNVAARKQTLTGNFSRWTYRRYRKFRASDFPFSRSCCKLSPMKIPSSRLTAPGSPRMVNDAKVV